MGWLFYNSDYIENGGRVNRKKELDNGFDKEKCAVLKSAMVGTVYYAAVQYLSTKEVFAYVALTSSDRANGYNFGVKSMDETMGPCEAKCPVGILNLLTETDDEWANGWRQRCRDYHESKKKPDAFENLPMGAKVKWTVPSEHFTLYTKGEEVVLTKDKERKRRTQWYDWLRSVRIPVKYVTAEDYVVLS